MRISDWSSDVCSSDLAREPALVLDRLHRLDRLAARGVRLPGPRAGLVGGLLVVLDGDQLARLLAILDLPTLGAPIVDPQKVRALPDPVLQTRIGSCSGHGPLLPFSARLLRASPSQPGPRPAGSGAGTMFRHGRFCAHRPQPADPEFARCPRQIRGPPSPCPCRFTARAASSASTPGPPSS